MKKRVTVPKTILRSGVMNHIHSETKNRKFHRKLERQAKAHEKSARNAGLTGDALIESVEDFINGKIKEHNTVKTATPSTNPLRAEKKRLRREEGVRIPTSKITTA